MINSESDDRVKNNTVRHKYRVLTEEEKADMLRVKDLGADFLDLLDNLNVHPYSTREISIAKSKIEEAVMWAVKHITK